MGCFCKANVAPFVVVLILYLSLLLDILNVSIVLLFYLSTTLRICFTVWISL